MGRYHPVDCNQISSDSELIPFRNLRGYFFPKIWLVPGYKSELKSARDGGRWKIEKKTKILLNILQISGKVAQIRHFARHPVPDTYLLLHQLKRKQGEENKEEGEKACVLGDSRTQGRGRYGRHHSLVGSKLIGSAFSIRIFVGASSPHLRHRRVTKENRWDVDVGTKDGQKKSLDVYSVSRPGDWEGIETPEILIPRHQASRPGDWQGIEIPEILNPRNHASRPGDWQGIKIPELLNPTNQTSRPGDWQGIEIPENLNPRNQALRPGDWQGFEIPKILNPRNQASRPWDWMGIEIPEILSPRNQASRLGDWQGIEIPEILNPRNQASRPRDWLGIEVPELLNPRNHELRLRDWKGIEIPEIKEPGNKTWRLAGI
ncbi:trichohyalin-like isoform X1 [Senna tora]|uniref:Trichohyalin-like isoform X1 n=1 Tax=Senna tora TaxID=362788 RepID=A0A834T6A9_9FABA|nr:trichohyalin-like isoform X1 [Senna tora]